MVALDIIEQAVVHPIRAQVGINPLAYGDRRGYSWAKRT